VQQYPLQLWKTRKDVTSAGTKPGMVIYVPKESRRVCGYEIGAFAQSGNVPQTKDGRKKHISVFFEVIEGIHVVSFT
jgi:hypothetical protein